MRTKSWITATLLGTTLGGLLGPSLVVVPVVAVPAPPSVPDTVVTKSMLSKSTVHEGWSATEQQPGNLVSVTWNGDPDARFSLETRNAKGRWRAAGDLASEQAGEGPDHNTLEYARATKQKVSSPLWVGDASAVRVKLTDGTAADVALSNVETPDPAPQSNVAGAAMIGQPGIITRVAWAANENLRIANCPEGPSYSDAVQMAVVHHTAGSNNYGPGDSAAIVRGLYGYATQTLHYCDTHYNFFVDKYGQIFEGRYGGMDRPVLAAHATGANWNTVGIALIGDYSTVSAPPAMIASLQTLIAWKFAGHGIDPTRPVSYTTLTGTDRWAAGTTHVLPAIVGHRDPGLTSCPGQRVYDLLPAIRANVAARIVFGATDISPPIVRQTNSRVRIVVGSAYGPIYPAGNAPRRLSSASWPGWPIGRDVAVLPGAKQGYVLDGFGGLHPFGGAPPRAGASWPGWDIARDLILLPNGGGYVLDGLGGIHPFGGAPVLGGGPRFTFDIAKKLVILQQGAYVLDGYGGIHPVGGAPPMPGQSWPGANIARDLVRNPTGPGGYLLDGFGGAWAVGGAPGITTPYYGRDIARALIMRPAGGGYSLQEDGKLAPFGGAPTLRQTRTTFTGVHAITTPFVINSAASG